MEIGQAITLIMKGIHSTASPTVSLSDVVADSCLNLIGPYVHPSVRCSLSRSLSRSLSYVISFMISYNRPDQRGGAALAFRSGPETIFVVHAPCYVQLVHGECLPRRVIELTTYNSTRHGANSASG